MERNEFLILRRTPEDKVETLVNLVFDDPFAFGMSLVDASRTIAGAYAKDEGADLPEHYLARLREGFDAEWNKPTSDVKMRREEKPSAEITELPTGNYDAVRTLRHVLQHAEKGELDDVIIICGKRVGEGDEEHHPKSMTSLWASWSDMLGVDVWWMQGWFNSWLTRRYFGRYHQDD